MMAVAGFRARLLPFAGRISSSGQRSAAISISAAAAALLQLQQIMDGRVRECGCCVAIT
jgi:hypothetical protein